MVQNSTVFGVVYQMTRTAERAVDKLIATELRIQDNRMPSHPSKRKLKDRKAEAAQWPQMLLSYTLQTNLYRYSIKQWSLIGE